MTVVANAVTSKKKINVGGDSRFYEGVIQCEFFVINGGNRRIPEYVTNTCLPF
jgi:hypothetical protein